MKRHLLFALALTGISFSANVAFANSAMVVLGEGPERACFQAAKSGLDSIAGIGHCNIALGNPLIISDRVATLVNRGVILHKLQRIQSAMDDFNTALRILPEQADAHVNRGVARLTLNEFDAALADIQRGIELGPSEPALAYYNRAITFERMGRIPEAYYDYQRALKEAPGFTAAVNALSRFTVRPRV
jgi:tetratricopeptide (TPR) repeat protein